MLEEEVKEVRQKNFAFFIVIGLIGAAWVTLFTWLEHDHHRAILIFMTIFGAARAAVSPQRGEGK